MITFTTQNCFELRGLSTDEKPKKATFLILGCPKLGNGSTFLEMDTARVWMYDEENDLWWDVTFAKR